MRDSFVNVNDSDIPECSALMTITTAALMTVMSRQNTSMIIKSSIIKKESKLFINDLNGHGLCSSTNSYNNYIH